MNVSDVVEKNTYSELILKSIFTHCCTHDIMKTLKCSHRHGSCREMDAAASEPSVDRSFQCR